MRCERFPAQGHAVHPTRDGQYDDLQCAKQVKLNPENLSATRQLDPAVKAQFDVVQKIELVLKVGSFQLRCQGREDQSRSLGSTTSRHDGVHHGR